MKKEKEKAAPIKVIATILLLGLGNIGFLLIFLYILVKVIQKVMEKNQSLGDGRNLARNMSAKVKAAHPTRPKAEKSEFHPAHSEQSWACRECGDYHSAQGIGLSRAKRLEQLDSLKKAGLYSEEEYRTAKARILHETAGV